MAKKKTPILKEVTVDKISQYDFEGKVIGVIEMLEECIKNIPPEYQESAQLEEYCEYGETYNRFILSYFRPETKEEEAARIEKNNTQLDYNINNEKKQLRNLIEKYGSDPSKW